MAGSRRARCAGALLAIPLAALVLIACEESPAPGDLRGQLRHIEPPHIVLILVDTLRADWTSPYDGEASVSPELGRWAERGVVFERALAQSSWTKVSMASLLTSLWPRTHGIRLPSDGLAEEALTLQDVLRDAGYRTYAVQSNGWLDQSFGFQQGFDRYVFPRSQTATELSMTSLWPHAERILEEAIRLIDAHDASDPLFLYLHFMDVHEYAAPPEYRTYGDDQRGFYLAAIRWVDDIVGRVRRQLEQAGLAERSVMIFASDHGETFGENQSHGHARNVFSSVLHVPLVIRFPFPMEGLRVRPQVRNLDIAPTLLDIAGLPIPAAFEGESLLALIESPGSEPDRESFAGLGAPILRGAIEQNSVNDGAWSYARNVGEGGKEFLFDRAVDPREDANLVDLESEMAARMREALGSHLAVEAHTGARESDVRIDPAIAERLRAVGYLQ